MEHRFATPRQVHRFAGSDAGGVTAFSLFMVVTTLMLGAFAVDLSRVNALEAKLQATADVAAQAAIVTRAEQDETKSKAMALKVAALNMPVATNGNVLASNDVQFGTWNAQTRLFTPTGNSIEAVRVTTRRTHASGNPMKTMLFRLVGLDELDVAQQAIMTGYDPDCLREGFVAQGPVDIQSNNSYKKGFCIHSNTVVKVSSGNLFEPGVKVSMPNKANILLPNSGFSSNPGLQDALSSNRYDIRILQRINAIITGLRTPGSRFIPAYIVNTSIKILNNNNLKVSSFTQGRIHEVSCSGNQSLTIPNGGVIDKVVIITNCKVNFANGASLSNVIIATTSADSRSFNGPNGVIIGKNDNCGTGGGAQLVTMGSMSFASGLEVYGGQLIAAGDIAFSASGLGIKGASFVAGGTISGTSGMTMAYCDGAGMEQNLRATYARLVN